MKNQELNIPEKSVLMKTNRDYRLSSLSGRVINFKADVPVKVHPFAYLEAISIGAVVTDEQEAPVLGKGPEEAKHVIHESVAEAARLEHAAKIEEIEKAIVVLIKRGDNTEFKADGYPKAKNVLDVLAPHVPKPTATEIQEVFDDMRNDVQYADLMGA